MISTALVLASAAFAMQPDNTRRTQHVFWNCLRTFVDRAVIANMVRDQFNREYSQACLAEEAAYREAVIARDTTSRVSRPDPEGDANVEIHDARANFQDVYDLAQATPR
jgi:hypothetical protein